MDSQQWATIISALGIGAALVAVIKGLFGWADGSHAREKSRNQGILEQRDDAWAERDKERARANRERDRADREATRRRQLSEYASHLRQIAIDHGVDPADLPNWPAHFTPTDQEGT